MNKFLSYTLTTAGAMGSLLSHSLAVHAADRLVYDSISNTTLLARPGTTVTENGATTPGVRSTIGNGFNLTNTAGLDPNNLEINRIQFRLVTGMTAQNYNALQVRIQFYEDISNMLTGPLFLNGEGIYTIALTPSMLTDVGTGQAISSLNLLANRQYDLDLRFDTFSLLDVNTNGVAINFQGDQGIGFVNSASNLSTVVRRGGAFAFGSGINGNDVVPTPDGNPDGVFFRDVEGDRDLNFDPDGSDSFNLPTQNGTIPASYDAVYMRLFANDATVVVPETNTFALLALGVAVPIAGLVRRRRK